jgi:hypothetical protein
MPYKRDVIQYFFYFATFSMKNKNFKPLKLKDSTQGHVCRDTTVSVKIKKLNFTIFSIIITYITPFPITIRKTLS